MKSAGRGAGWGAFGFAAPDSKAFAAAGIAAIIAAMFRIQRFVLVLLAIEFLDELVFGAEAAAWPLIRDDLGLTYTQIGLLLGIPVLVSAVVEPVLGILGDVWRRRVLVLGGGIAFAVAAAMVGSSTGFTMLLLALALFYPASGAFVSLSQASLMDFEPERHEQNMARWTFAGSVGVVLGPLALGGAVAVGWGWRGLFWCFAALAALAVVWLWRTSFPSHVGGGDDAGPSEGFRAGLAGAIAALRRREVLRWLTLLQFSDLMLDVLFGYLALYFVDVAGVSAAQAGVAVLVWTAVGMVGDFLIIPLLERVSGLAYLRVSAAIVLVVFPAFLLVPVWWAKLALLGALGLLNSGWYAILQAQLYSAMPGKSGAAMAVSNIFGWVGALLPLALGLAADRFGLGTTLWLLMAGPIALLVGLPYNRGGREEAR